MSTKLIKINEDLKRELNLLISMELKNPDIPLIVSVTEVRMTNDYKHAKVFISVLGTAKQKEKTLAALKKSKGFLRSSIAKTLNLRSTPEFHFELDESMENGNKIETILNKVLKEEKND